MEGMKLYNLTAAILSARLSISGRLRTAQAGYA
ncbi:hypothetical protein ABIB60_001890 [Hymenobacter sp. UYP22]